LVLVVAGLIAREPAFLVALEAVATLAEAQPFNPPHPREALAMLARWPVVVVPVLRLPVIRLVSATLALLLVPPYLVPAVRVVARKLLAQTPIPAMAARLVLAMQPTPVLLAW
jgi:hypothetical protein